MRVPMPVLFAVVCGAACQETVSPALPVAPSAQTAVSGDSLRLTYICGNTFRIRNSNDQYVEVKWDIFNTSDSGRLVLPRRPLGQPFSQVFVTANRLGTMRLFYAGRLEETKANGNRPACVTDGQETPWPAPELSAVATRFEPSIRLRRGEDTVSYSRTEGVVVFATGSSPMEQRAILRALGVTVIANDGSAGFVVAWPDPGPDSSRVEARWAEIRSHPGVASFLPLFRLPRASNDARYPNDALGVSGPAELLSSQELWFARHLRLPAAWGCMSTSDTTTRLIAIEALADRFNPEYVDRIAALRFPEGDDATPLSDAQAKLDHSAAVIGLMSAVPDNGDGVAGATFGARLKVLQLRTASGGEPDFRPALAMISEAIRASGVVVNLASDYPIGRFGTADDRQALLTYAQRVLIEALTASDRSSLTVVSAGNDAVRARPDSFALRPDAQLLHVALFRLRLDPSFSNRIVVVAGIDQSGDLWASSNFVLGGTDVAAPADQVLLLRSAKTRPVPTTVSSGTSYSAPLVASIIAAMRSADPTLSPESIKRLLVSGSRLPKAGANGGVSAPVSVGGVPSGQTVWSVDAYGPLKLVAGLSARAPLCGQRVSLLEGVTGAYLSIARDSLATERVDLPSAYRARRPDASGSPSQGTVFDWGSIAQGGRMISVNAEDPEGRPRLLTYALDESGWTLKENRIAPYYRTYLERDTAYVRWLSPDGVTTGGIAGEVRRGNGTIRTLEPVSVVDVVSRTGVGRLTSASLSPDGSTLAVGYRFGNPDFCFGPFAVGAGVVVLDVAGAAPPQSVVVDSTAICAEGFPQDAQVAWHPNSRDVVSVISNGGFAPGQFSFTARAHRRGSASYSLVGSPGLGLNAIAELGGVRGDGEQVDIRLLDVDTEEVICQRRLISRLNTVLAVTSGCPSTARQPLLRGPAIQTESSRTTVHDMRARLRALDLLSP